MFREALKKLRRLRVEPVPFDPTVLGDTLATRTDWDPLVGGGSNFRTHRLAPTGPHRMSFKATPGALAFYLLFLTSGLAIILGFGFVKLATGFSLGAGWESILATVLPIVVGLVFAGAGGLLLYTRAAPIVFDKRRGEFWKGRVAPSEVARPDALDTHAPLDRLHALQIISEHCTSDDSSYYSYELNLVLDDGTRLNVVDHGDLDELRRDAETLAAFLDRPIWDATARV